MLWVNPELFTNLDSRPIIEMLDLRGLEEFGMTHKPNAGRLRA
jgi:hypothetical protein